MLLFILLPSSLSLYVGLITKGSLLNIHMHGIVEGQVRMLQRMGPQTQNGPQQGYRPNLASQILRPLEGSEILIMPTEPSLLVLIDATRLRRLCEAASCLCTFVCT
jgi:hypothetical protein